VAGSFSYSSDVIVFFDTQAKAQSVAKNSHLMLGSSNYQPLTALQ